MVKSRTTLIALVVLTAVLMSACVPVIRPGGLPAGAIRGSGKLASREYPVEGFNAVDVNSAFKVTITPGDSYQVTVTTDDNLLEYVNVTKQGNTLYIKMGTSGDQGLNSTVREARVTMPGLQSVRVNGASQVDMSGSGMAPAFEGNVDGASRLEGTLQATDIRLRANGASRYNLSGQGTTLSVSADGASQALLDKLAVDRANVSLNGASHATVNAKSSLDYDLNGASQLRYAGNPAIGTAQAEGASSARPQ